MSYILEALRKSQREREMTQAPVSGLQDLPGAAESGGGNRWVIATMLTAVAAVAISLYAVVGSRLESPPEGGGDSMRADMPPARAASGADSEAGSDPARPPHAPLVSGGSDPPASLEQRKTSDRPSSDRVAVAPRAGSRPIASPSAGDLRTPAEQTNPPAAPGGDFTSVISPVGPREAAIPSPDERSATGAAAEESAGPRVERDAQAGQARGTDPLQVDAPQRQGKSNGRATELVGRGSRDDGASGAFRREAEQLRSRLLGVDRASTQERRPSAPDTTSRDVSGMPSPQDSTTLANVEPLPKGEAAGARIPSVGELPAQLFKSLPPRNILVHVYREAPDARFIILNSRRQKQGDTTKDGFVIEEIQPDGVVLRFRGQQFFNPR